MNRLFIILLIVLGLLVPSYSYAQVQPSLSSSVSSSQVMSPEDMVKMREQLAELSKAMGNPSPAASAKPPETKPPEIKPKGIEEVADKALDMVGSAVATLSNSLSKIAPHVWRIMIVQQYAKAIDGILTPTLFLLLLGVVTMILRKNIPPPKAWDNNWDSDDCSLFWIRTIGPVIFMCIFGIWFVIGAGDSIKLIINPEYYAIKDILLMLTNPGATTL